ncbi:MAG: hypothetical protein DHS20C11_18390 [Lysobacteraceae bacterium]|nr:MAG: hypothetical protein DHS20C11_18390 [Xanthomonadaceae bacterium]
MKAVVGYKGKSVLRKSVVIALVVMAFLLLVWNLAMAPQTRLEQFDVDAQITDAMLVPKLQPDARPFLMGFTYQPYDWNDEAFDKTFSYLRKHGDLITLFHDVGIPWDEALSKSPLPKSLEQELRRQQRGAADFDNVVVMLSVLGSDRVSLTQSIGETGSVPRSGDWADRTFDDNEVVTAYLNHARHLIERFKPKYFSYVAEIDAVFNDPNDHRFQQLLTFSRTVYETLKVEYPQLVVFAEFNLNDDAYMAERQDIIDAMLPYTDLYAVSTYADHNDAVGGDATKLPADWFTRVKFIAPSKPFAILESGFIASPFMHPTIGVPIAGRQDRLLIPGGPKSQALFTVKMLDAAHELEAEFINLWAVRDLDLLFDRFAANSEFNHPMLRTAQDRGLYDETGNPRPALEVWEYWRRLPLETQFGVKVEVTVLGQCEGCLLGAPRS